MKRIFFLVAIFSFLFSSCIFVNDNSGQEPDNPPVDENTALVTFENKSKFDVNIYLGSNPYIGAVSCTVPASSTNYSKSFIISKDQSIGDVFYIEYLIKIGNAVFPYWTHEASSGWKSQTIKKDGNNKIIIDELIKCESKSAYLLIENNTDSEVRVNNATTPLKPLASEVALISKGSCGVYEVSPLSIYEPADINLGYLDGIKIKVDVTNELSLPVSNAEVVAGNVYTISVNKEKDDKTGKISASLKAITPFNIDTQRKIWSLDNSIFTPEYATVMRPSYDKKSTLVMGTAAVDVTKIGIARIDEYGKETTFTGDFAAFTNSSNHLYTEIVDFVEQQDGSIVMLFNQVFGTSVDNLDSENYVIICYNFNTKSIKWSKILDSNVTVPESNITLPKDSRYMYVFRKDTKNKLVQLTDDKFVFVGAYDNYKLNENNYLDFDRYHQMITYIDGSKIDESSENKTIKAEGIKESISAKYSDYLSGLEAQATSVYYDDEGRNLYICGYENFDAPDYDENPVHEGYEATHTGKIWKTNLTDLESGSFNFAEKDVIYSYNNCLFFSIEGSGSNFVVCGECKTSGNILKGCFITSAMIENSNSSDKDSLVLYTLPKEATSINTHCWFNQLCQYGNKIVLCGTADSKRDGSENPLPFVVAFDRQGNKLWENLTYTSYTSALNILPNTIGTYTLQLGNDKDNKIHYVNADLLGNEAN